MKWAYIMEMNNDAKINLTENYCHFLNSEITEVDTKTNEQEILGMDGVLVGTNTFGPFELTLKFHYNGGIDSKDLTLFAERMKEIIHVRKPRYVVHSDMPGKKYAYNNAKIEWEVLNAGDLNLSITFSCYKGYSESRLSTDDMKLSNLHDWQFGNGYLAFDETDDFHHRTKKFRIYNGSSDAIDPTLRHTLNITVHANAPKGFKIRSLTTGDVFEYTGSLVYTDTFMLKGVYPVKNGSRVGADTNMSWLTLENGFNYFVVEGEGLSDFDITFSFNFIYR
ncbi:MAG: phage tail family protein [Staphylococcus equorum]|nr:phage tail family protein [Staphylococcus equorum]